MCTQRIVVTVLKTSAIILFGPRGGGGIIFLYFQNNEGYVETSLNVTPPPPRYAEPSLYLTPRYAETSFSVPQGVIRN